MSATAVQEGPNTQEMVVIHRIFRRGFAQLADLARRVPAHDTAWAGAVAAHAEFLLNGLHHHHTAEDELCGRGCWNARSRTLCSSPAWRTSTRSSPHT